MAHFLVYRTYAKEFMAPLFHYIVPGHEFFEKPSRLIQIQEWFTHLRLAFDTDRRKLLREVLQDQRLQAPHKSVVQNLKDLLYFVIPAVTHVRTIKIVFIIVHLVRTREYSWLHLTFLFF